MLRSRSPSRPGLSATLAILAALALGAQSQPQEPPRGAGATAGNPNGPATPKPLPSIAEKTESLRKIDGFFPLHWDSDHGKLLMEVDRWDVEVLHINGLGAGLGSNDIGIDRGALAGSRVVEFERVGRKVLMVQPNYRFRSSSTSDAERKAVRDAFARSVLWGFTAIAATGDAVLVDLTDFLLRDSVNLAPRLRPGTYRLEKSRSSVYLPMVMGFPRNTEIEVELTFVSQPSARGGGSFPFPGFSGFRRSTFEGVGRVAASGQAASIRLHHSFVALPDEGYQPRRADSRDGYITTAYQDYSVGLGEPMTQRLINRHRLEKKDPAAVMSEAVEPIVYYLDPGTPEPIRSALVEGAGWWNQAFEAAGYRNGFQVKLLPDGVSTHDIRYNVINWVHRSTRGWSTGGSVTDPRTGEIIKGVVTLGSLRIRQDYMIAEGLLSPYSRGDENPPELAEWALARIRQLSAHEVGHTIGLSHNYYDSAAGRISVMDYPHPLVRLAADGSFDMSQVYDDRIGEWDKVAINYGYRTFAPGTDAEDTEQALRQILDRAWDNDVRFLTNQDTSVHPRADQWANGTDPGAELERMMEVRRVALSRFGENAIRSGAPLATLEEVLVPLYLHHRFQIEAAASALGGVDYVYAFRGDGREPMRPASSSTQAQALRALIAGLHPKELALPTGVLAAMPPRPSGYRAHRELFPRYTGGKFDAITPAVVAADHIVSNVLNPQRAARLVEQHALNTTLPGLDTVLDALFAGTFGAQTENAYQAEVRRATERVLIDRLIGLAGNAAMPQVRALATHRLESEANDRLAVEAGLSASDAAHYRLLALDIGRFLRRPAESAESIAAVGAPPGAPIGQPAMDWLSVTEPECGWEEAQHLFQ